MATELEIQQGMLDVAKEAVGLQRFDIGADNEIDRNMLLDARDRTAIFRASVEATRLWQAEMLKAAQAQAAAAERQAKAVENQPRITGISRRHAAAWMMSEAIRELGSAKAAGTLVEEYLAELDRIAPEA